MDLVYHNPFDPAPFENAGPMKPEKKNNIGLIIFGLGMIAAVGAVMYLAHHREKLANEMKETKTEKEEE